eukprot:scaffold38122_cov64-Phaeocystis_antarctica.AAC.4
MCVAAEKALRGSAADRVNGNKGKRSAHRGPVVRKRTPMEDAELKIVRRSTPLLRYRVTTRLRTKTRGLFGVPLGTGSEVRANTLMYVDSLR